MTSKPGELLTEFAKEKDLIDDEGVPIDGPEIDRAELGAELILESHTTHFFAYLQRLVAGDGQPLHVAPPNVRIVTARDGAKEDYALIYGYPANPDGTTHSDLATRFPDQAVVFKVYYGRNYGPGGYDKVETFKPIDPEFEAKLRAGDFTDEEAEELLAEKARVAQVYWDLNGAARDPDLNPDFAERVNATFYENAAKAGIG